jgi:signal transduction histidine kinase
MGISKFDPRTCKFRNFDVYDGLAANEFYMGACAKDGNGNLYFGSNNGVIYFSPDSIKDNPFIPPVYITGFKIFNKLVPDILQQDISETKTITLNHKQSVISFDFVAINYIQPEKNQYAYMMEGFDKDWIYCGTKREVTYTNLDPGKYIFRVKASNNDGVWNNKGDYIKITIRPPWWGTKWFKISALLIFLLSLYVAYYLRIELFRTKEKELTILVRQRTVEISRANEILLERQTSIEEYAENLKEANELLINKQKLIENQSNQLLVLNATKDRFFSIIAHDLRNPFHVISGFAEILLNDNHKFPAEKKEKFLQMIHTSSLNGSNLLENLLQWSRAQTGRITYSPVTLSIVAIVEETITLLEADAERKNIVIKSRIDPTLTVSADENMLKTIFRNLISNAIKFTHNGSIIIETQIKEKQLEVSITDTGIGIPKDTLDLLFRIDGKVSTKGTANETGTGLGLILCKEFIEKHGGKIWAESEVGTGSKFKFTIPLD